MKRLLTRRGMWIPIMIALLALGAFIIFGNNQQKAPAILVSATKSTGGEFVRESRATGSVEARTYTLNFSRPGRVARVLVQAGTRVEKGALLSELDTQDSKAQLASAQQSLLATNLRLQTNQADSSANFSKLNSSLVAAKQKLALTQSLYSTGTVSKFELDDAGRAVTDLESQARSLTAQTAGGVGDLNAQRAAKQSEIEQLNRAIAQAQLRAPVSGTIANIGYLPGTETAANNIHLIEDATLEVRLRLQESDASFVKIGQPAQVELDAVAGQSLAAKVVRVDAQAEVSGQGGSAILPVILRFTDARARNLARPGLTATGHIITQRISGASIVPLEAMVEDGKQSFVWKIVNDKEKKIVTAKKTAVTVLSRNLTSAAVKGIDANTQLISLPSEELTDGASIKLPAEKREAKKAVGAK